MKENPTTFLPLRASKSGATGTTVHAPEVLQELIGQAFILPEDWETLPHTSRDGLMTASSLTRLLPMLVERGLLTDYQAGRIEAGTTFGLVMGNYRILDRVGAGGMGVVFRAEHMIMRRQVAIKVLPLAPDQDQRILRRFLTEIRAIAQLQHPNIVGAMDAGEVGSPENGSVLHFFVMEYVPGEDLEEYVLTHGPLSPTKACDLIHQVASALAEAHNHHLVHRDIKPSNIRVTPEGQAKLLDFGLTRNFKSSMTEPGTLLGTLDYMAPEQVQNAHTVDIRADLYGLGGVLYWCLIGETPFPSGSDNIVQELTLRLTQQPPSICLKRPELSPELDAVLQKMMALHPDERYATPQEVMRALLPFLKPELRDHLLVPALTAPAAPASLVGADAPAGTKAPQILLVDDEPDLRTFCRYVLQAEGFECDEAESAERAQEIVKTKEYDLLVLDINLSGMSGPELCRYLREHPPSPHLKIVMASGNNNSDIMAQMLLSGADDFLTKPFSVVQLQARVKAALRLKEAQDRRDVLHRHLLAVNQELEKSLGARDTDLVQARNALVLALAKMVEHRACETGAHLTRLQKYCRSLGEEAMRSSAVAGQLDARFIEMLECCAPLHDVGKIGLPDHILQKPGKLDTDERLLMQTHTVIGAETLDDVARSHGSAMAFLHVAIDIVRHHHERFDGTGYPDRLAGADIPLAARLFAICDVYDALRSRRIYKPALSQNSTVQLIVDASGTQFDPALVQAFLRCAPQFERIFKESPD